MRFPGLSNEIMDIVSKAIFKQVDRTRKVTDAIIEAENGYQFTNDKYYLEQRTEIVPADAGNAPRQHDPHGQMPAPGQ